MVEALTVVAEVEDNFIEHFPEVLAGRADLLSQVVAEAVKAIQIQIQETFQASVCLA